jgi:hypothetical protein
MNDGTAPKGGPGNMRRFQGNTRRRRPWSKCPECGARCPTASLLRRHQLRDCHGIPFAQLNFDDALAAQLEGFDEWHVFTQGRAS